MCVGQIIPSGLQISRAQCNNILTPFLAKSRFWFQNEAGNTSYSSATILTSNGAIFTKYTNVRSLPGNFPAGLCCDEQQNVNSRTSSLSLHGLHRGSFVFRATKS